MKESSNGFMLEKSPDTRKGLDDRRCVTEGLEAGDASVTDNSTIFGIGHNSPSLLLDGILIGAVGSAGDETGGDGGCSMEASDFEDDECRGSKSSRRLSHPVRVWVYDYGQLTIT